MRWLKVTIFPHNIGLIAKDIALSCPVGLYPRITSRSMKNTNVGAGVIDFEYRGNVKVVILNHSKEKVSINCGIVLRSLFLLVPRPQELWKLMIQIKIYAIRKVLVRVEYKCKILCFIVNSRKVSRKIFFKKYVPCYQEHNTIP